MNKKAQITMFVIIGLVVIIATGLVLHITSELTRDNPRVKEPEVSLEARPVISLITNCLDITAKEALITMGLQGGKLIDPFVVNSGLRSEGMNFEPYEVPYWRYMLSDCQDSVYCEQTMRPPLCKLTNQRCGAIESAEFVNGRSVEEQIEEYILRNVPLCVNDFESVQVQYDIKSDGPESVNVIFGEDKTDVVLSYPFVMTSLSTGDIKQVDDYIVSYDLELRNLFVFADEVLSYIRDTDLYERSTMNLINIYAGMDAEDLPPTNELTIGSTKNTFWVRSDVQNTVQYDVLPFMSLIRFMDTSNFHPLVTPDPDDWDVSYEQYINGFYQSLTPPLNTERSFPVRYEVYHDYLYDPVYLSIINQKEVISGQKMPVDNLLMKMFTFMLKDFRFGYDITYPLLIRVVDPDAFGGEGYTLQFAIQVNVRNNVPAYQDFEYVQYPSPKELSAAQMDLRLPQEITIRTYDRQASRESGKHVPLEDVVITYVCGREYEIGQTMIDVNGQAILKTTLPYCEMGGYLTYKKFGYLGQSEPFDNTLDGKAELFDFSLWPVHEREARMSVRNTTHVRNLLDSTTDILFHLNTNKTSLSQHQAVMFNIERIKETPFETDLPLQSFIYFVPGDYTIEDEFNIRRIQIEEQYKQGTITLETRNELIREILGARQLALQNQQEIPIPSLDLVPGTYSVEATLLDSRGVYIPRERRCEGGTLFTSCTEVILEPMNFTTWVGGGAVFEWVITPPQVYTDEPIEFTVIEMPLPQSWTELEELPELEDYLRGKEILYAHPRSVEE